MYDNISTLPGEESGMDKDSQLYKWAMESDNVADDLKQEELDELAMKCIREYEIDCDSRSDWERTADAALKAVGMDRQAKNYPWPNASNVKLPFLLEAVMQYNARSYPAIVSDNGIVKIRAVGYDPEGHKRARAARVGRYMSDQFIEEMHGWEEDTDALLMQQPVVGCVFRKVYKGYNKKACAEMVTAFDCVVNSATKTLDNVPRITHRFDLYPHEIMSKVREGSYLEVDFDQSGEDPDIAQEFLEQHRYIDLDEDGIPEPWIVTVHKDTEKVVRIEAGYDIEKIEKKRGKITKLPRKVCWIKYPFIPDPAGGFYDYGFGKITESLIETANSTINQMMDAGHLQTAGGGFIGQNLQLTKSGGTVRVSPGKYVPVKTGSAGRIQDSIYHHQHPGPSTVLFQLLGLLIEQVKGLTSIKDIMTGELGRNQPATTTLAMIEQGMKVYTAIYKRVYRSLKQEFQAVYEINRYTVTEDDYEDYHDREGVTALGDFETSSKDILPVADPNMVLDMQRASKAQVLLENAKDPELGPLHDKKEALKRFYEAVNIDVEGVLDPQPTEEEVVEQEQAKEIQLADAAAQIQKTEAEAQDKMASAAKKIEETEQMRQEAEAEAYGSEFDAAMAPFFADDTAEGQTLQ